MRSVPEPIMMVLSAITSASDPENRMAAGVAQPVILRTLDNNLPIMSGRAAGRFAKSANESANRRCRPRHSAGTADRELAAPVGRFLACAARSSFLPHPPHGARLPQRSSRFTRSNNAGKKG